MANDLRLHAASGRIAGLHRHFRDGLYNALFLAHSSDNGEPMVVYVQVGTGNVFVRPLAEWDQEVEIEAGVRVPRFQKLYGAELDQVQDGLDVRHVQECIAAEKTS